MASMERHGMTAFNMEEEKDEAWDEGKKMCELNGEDKGVGVWSEELTVLGVERWLEGI